MPRRPISDARLDWRDSHCQMMSLTPVQLGPGETPLLLMSFYLFRSIETRQGQEFFCFLLPSRFVRTSMPRGRWFSTKTCQERCGSKYCVVHALHRCSGLAISQMSTSTSQPHPRNRRRWQSSGTRQHMQPIEANVRVSRTPDDDAVAIQANIEKLEKAVEILGEESPQAQGLIAALKQARERAVVRLDSCQAFVERARKRLIVAEEEDQGTPREKYSRIRARARVGKVGAVARRGSVTRKGSPSTGCSRSSRNHSFNFRSGSESPACNCRRIETGASVSDGSVGTTDRDSSSNREVWEDGDVDRRCRCRFESFQRLTPY